MIYAKCFYCVAGGFVFVGVALIGLAGGSWTEADSVMVAELWATARALLVCGVLFHVGSRLRRAVVNRPTVAAPIRSFRVV